MEGVLDVHQFRARQIQNVVALGGTSARPELFARLRRLGVERITLCLDNDEPGRTATAKAVEAAARAPDGPEVRAVDPGWLEPHADPDAFVRHDGTDAWKKLIADATCGIAWRAHELLGDTTARSDAASRKAALARAGRWLGTLSERLSLEQEDAIRAAAERCGYSPEAVERAFRAHYWDAPTRARQSRPQALAVER